MKILVVTMHSDRTVAEASLNAGAKGFIPKEATLGELDQAISEVLAGRRFISDLVPRWSHHAGLAGPHQGLSRLTPRQRQIVLLMGQGRSGAEIARLLVISPSAITFHKHRIMKELGFSDDAGLLQYAVLVRSSIDSESSQTIASRRPK